MESRYIGGNWKAVLKDGEWEIRSSDDKLIAHVIADGQSEANARLIAASPILLEALSALVQLIGEDDLPDNGELSGAAICDLARSALAIAMGTEA